MLKIRHLDGYKSTNYACYSMDSIFSSGTRKSGDAPKVLILTVSNSRGFIHTHTHLLDTHTRTQITRLFRRRRRRDFACLPACLLACLLVCLLACLLGADGWSHVVWQETHRPVRCCPRSPHTLCPVSPFSTIARIARIARITAKPHPQSTDQHRDESS
jgi:hypothetical protein